MGDPYQRLSHREIYRNPWLAVEHHDIIHPTGLSGEHVLIVGRPSSGVVVLNADDELVFTQQPRFAVAGIMLEIVKGGADEGENALAAAQRELREEMGFIARSWCELGIVYELPSLMRDPITLFLARDLNTTSRALEETEDITVHCIPRRLAVEQAVGGEITDAVTCVAILRANALIDHEPSLCQSDCRPTPQAVELSD